MMASAEAAFGECMAERRLKVDHSTIARWVRPSPSSKSVFDLRWVTPNGPGGWMKPTFGLPCSGPVYIGTSVRLRHDRLIGFLLSPKSRRVCARGFLQLALCRPAIDGPRVINMDGPGISRSHRKPKRVGELGRNCGCRRSPYVNNFQNHRFVKKLVASQ
jgi:transposase-like protein